jgi:hypothetical protein
MTPCRRCLAAATHRASTLLSKKEGASIQNVKITSYEQEEVLLCIGCLARVGGDLLWSAPLSLEERRR